MYEYKNVCMYAYTLESKRVYSYTHATMHALSVASQAQSLDGCTIGFQLFYTYLYGIDIVIRVV